MEKSLLACQIPTEVHTETAPLRYPFIQQTRDSSVLAIAPDTWYRAVNKTDLLSAFMERKV